MDGRLFLRFNHIMSDQRQKIFKSRQPARAAPSHCPLNKQNIIYFIYKREKPTKLSGIPYFWSRSSLLMSEFENFQTLTPAGNFAPAFDRKIRNF